VSERTVRRWIASGQLKVDKSGASFRVPLEALAPYLAASADTGGQAADSWAEADTNVRSDESGSTLETEAPQQVSEASYLADLLREAQAENVRNASAAAMWQARAEYLATELEQMKALPAGRGEDGATPAAEPPDAVSKGKRKTSKGKRKRRRKAGRGDR
jgi:excisionase family DNA binding protein